MTDRKTIEIPNCPCYKPYYTNSAIAWRDKNNTNWNVNNKYCNHCGERARTFNFKIHMVQGVSQ